MGSMKIQVVPKIRRCLFYFKPVILFSTLTVLILPFQNCGKVTVTETLQKSEKESSQGVRATNIQFNEVAILVDVNQPKTFNILSEASVQSFAGQISLDQNQSVSHLELPEGIVDLDLNQRGLIRFSPSFGFRGTINVNLFIRESDTDVQVIKLVFDVRNPFRDLKPSLAVRAAECMLCHGQVKGDVITDFGFKSDIDTKGSDHFYTGGGAYSTFHDTNNPSVSGWATVQIDGNLILPKVNLNQLPGGITRVYAPTRDYIGEGISKVAQTLKEYIEKITFSFSENSVSSIIEKDKVYIGAPTEDDIRLAGHLDENKFLNFAKSSESGPDLLGFSHYQSEGKDYYTNSSTETMICEGDIFIDGVVWLNHLKIKTDEGCRIYSTKSVFITGPIEYIDENGLTNLQVLSARGIYMGGGICVDCYSGSNDEYGTNFLYNRTRSLVDWGIGPLRDHSDMNIFLDQFHQDFLKVSNEGPLPPRPDSGVTDVKSYYLARLQSSGVVLVDAKANYEDTSTTPFRRLLLNAPVVESRYNGDFQGWIIAEAALWKLGSFKFQFDPVFKVVPIFPLMDINKILKVE